MTSGLGSSEPADVHGTSAIRESTESFGDRLAEFVRRRESQIVLGLDPDLERLWPGAVASAETGPSAGAGPDSMARAEATPRPDASGVAHRAARAVAAHCLMAIAAVAEECVAVKPQLARFERLGAPGWEALREVVEAAQAAGLLVIADAKRGDIDVSASAYAQAFLGQTPTPFGTVPGLGADALTVSPWLGGDSVAPFLDVARAHGRGLFVLVRNSNPGAADLQDRRLERGAGSEGETVSEAVARMTAELGASGLGVSGIADVGAVVAATAPDRIERLRELMPHAPFLLPGVGAQGGRVEDLAPAFAIGRAGGLIAASRSIVDAHRAGGFGSRGGAADPADAARRAAARLREQAWGLVSP